MTLLDGRALPAALFGSSVGHGRELAGWDASIRRPLSTARRIGFVSLVAGVGSTTLAAQVTRVLAARRTEPVLAVDVSDDEHGLARALSFPQTTPSDARAGARTTDDARDGLTAGAGWFGLRPASLGDPVGAWLAEAAPITRFFEVSVTDFGVRHPLADLSACAALCDVMCLVSDARRSPAELARALAPAIAGLPEAPTPVLALVDHGRSTRGTVAAAMADDPWTVVGVPFDAGVRAGGAPRGLATTRALLRLTASLVGAEAA